MPRWGKLQASTTTRGDVKALMARIEAPVLANQVLAAVSAIFTWAVREEILPANPCKLVARNPTRSRERVLSDSEIPTFWAAFDAAGLVASTALKMILVTGQRPGEVAHMRREHRNARRTGAVARLARHQERARTPRVAIDGCAGAAR
jgi:integrase